MRVITVEQNQFDREFEATLDKLKLIRFTSDEPDAKFENTPLGEMHRSFHYEVCRLKERLEKA